MDDLEATAEGGEDVESSAPDPQPEASSPEPWPKEVQAEYTRKSQALADERRNWESQRTQWSTQQQQQQQQLQNYAQQLQQQAQQGQGQDKQAGMIEQLRQMSYLDGPTAAAMMERILSEGINPLNSAIQQRDKALAHVYQQYKALNDRVGQAQGKQAEGELAARFTKARADHGLPDEAWANEYLQDVYYSHEGKDLNNAYPEMVRARLDAMRRGMRDMDRAAAQKAKASPFPSKGGEMSPVSGKTGGYKTPEARADELWSMLNPGSKE